MDVRSYGAGGPSVVLLHGGPGARGYLRPLAREIEDEFRVFEPLQRGSGADPLTVGTHIRDLHLFLSPWPERDRPALVGHSWGAMLALAYAAAHPGTVRSLVLIGCGSFDPESRARLHETIEARMEDTLRRRISDLKLDCPDPDERLRRLGDLLLPVYSHDPIARDAEDAECDARAYEETWADMLRLQASRVYPAAFAAIDAPVLMLHGAEDPHPGRMIHETLARHLPRLTYRELEDCGHYPWIERRAKAEFFETLRRWLRGRHGCETIDDSGGRADR